MSRASKAKTFWWVDDEPGRVEFPLVKKRIEKPPHPALRGVRATLLIKKVELGNLSAVETELAQTTAATIPDLIIIDQRLGEVHHARKLGSSLAVSLRAQRAAIPIVLVSADPDPQPVLSQQRSEGIDFIRVDSLQSGARVPDLFAIAAGFSDLIASLPGVTLAKRPKVILDLLKVPTGEHDTFLHCLPNEFLRNWDQETPHRFARWVWNDFLGRSGLIIDDLNVATLLGLDVSALPRLEKLLKPGQYAGCFNSAARPRWWISLVRDVVRKKTKGALTDPLSKLGRELVTQRSLHSRAYGHAKDDTVPDCVAYIDELMKDRRPALRAETRTLPYELPAPGFEPLRVFQGTGA